MSKRRIQNIVLVNFILLFVIPLFSSGQNNTSSPYSKFGLGDLASVGYGRNLALGGTGYGLRDPFYLNLKNPASLTAIDSLNFLYEIGVNGQYLYSTAVGHNEIYWNGNLTHVTFGHRYTSWLMGNYGLMPYTNIGYRIITSKVVEGEDSPVVTNWNGYGGINKIFYNLGIKISNNFSLGGEVAYYYGPITELRTSTILVQPDNPSIYYSNTRYHGFSYKGAFQFTSNLDKEGTNLTIGGTFTPKQTLRGKSEVIIEQQYSTSVIDSMYSNEVTATPIIMPMDFGAGLSFTWKGKYMFTADYEWANWSVNFDKTYIDQSIYSIGFERKSQNSLNYFGRCSYRAGFRYDSGYLNTKGYNIDDMRFSLGMGFPILKTRSVISTTLEVGQRGTYRMGLVQERYVKMTVALSLQDFWFVKRRLN